MIVRKDMKRTDHAEENQNEKDSSKLDIWLNLVHDSNIVIMFHIIIKMNHLLFDGWKYLTHLQKKTFSKRGMVNAHNLIPLPEQIEMVNFVSGYDKWDRR